MTHSAIKVGPCHVCQIPPNIIQRASVEANANGLQLHEARLGWSDGRLHVGGCRVLQRKGLRTRIRCQPKETRNCKQPRDSTKGGWERCRQAVSSTMAEATSGRVRQFRQAVSSKGRGSEDRRTKSPRGLTISGATPTARAKLTGETIVNGSPLLSRTACHCASSRGQARQRACPCGKWYVIWPPTTLSAERKMYS